MSADEGLRRQLHELRAQYVTGLHFNWHDYQFKPPALFDFFMAGKEDLRPVDDTPYRLLPMDACNFTPASYRPASAADKHWDVLAVGNPVFFKRPEVVLHTIRKLFDASPRPLRALYICPLPRYRFSDEDTVFYDVRGYYEALFSAQERASFTLLTTTFDSPNPFDRNTLSVFFRNSRVFLHCATEERRCRIAAYAWCAGLPVVAYPSVASILPPILRATPGYFEVRGDGEYVAQLLAAIEASPAFDAMAYQQEVSETRTVERLDDQLRAIFSELALPYEGALLAKNLDRRLGWHHQGIGGRANGLQQPLAAFMAMLATAGAGDVATRMALEQAEYPERDLAQETDEGDRPDVAQIRRKSVYLNPSKKFWFRAARSVKARLKW